MAFKSHNYTHFVLRDIQPMVDLVERRTIDVGGYIFDELRHFMSSRKGCRMNFGSLISFILRENGIWYLEDGEPVVTPTRFDAGHIHNMGLDLPLNMEERTYSMKRKKGASQAGSVPAEPSVAAGAGTSRVPRPRSPQTPPSARHGEDEQSSAPHHRASPGRFPVTREYLRSMISEVLTPMIRDMTETIVTASTERVITALSQRLPLLIADALARTPPHSSQPTDPSDSHIHTDPSSHEPEPHTGPSSELPTEPSTDPSPEQPHDPDTTTQPDPQPSTVPIPEPEEPVHVSDQSFSFAEIADIAREVVGDDHGPTPEVPTTGVVPPTVPPTEPAPESSRPSSPSLGFVSSEIPSADTRDFDHHVIQATPLQVVPPAAPSSVQPASSSSSGQPISIRDSSSSSPSDFDVDKKGENSCDDSYEGSD